MIHSVFSPCLTLLTSSFFSFLVSFSSSMIRFSSFLRMDLTVAGSMVNSPLPGGAGGGFGVLGPPPTVSGLPPFPRIMSLSFWPSDACSSIPMAFLKVPSISLAVW